jgi:hypothetical protein
MRKEKILEMNKDTSLCIECGHRPTAFIAPAHICKPCWMEWWNCEDCVQDEEGNMIDCVKHAKWDYIFEVDNE